MRRMAMMVGLLVGMCLSPFAKGQQDRAWWVMGESGEGEFKLSSDQVQSKRDPTFAFGFAGGHRWRTSKARFGLHVNGWLLDAFSINDPTAGQSMTNVMGIIDIFPFRYDDRLFVRGGFGLATYTDNREAGSGGHGPAWEGGAGYEFPLSEKLSLIPMAEYSGGRLGDANNHILGATGRRFSVAEFKLALVYRFGRHRD